MDYEVRKATLDDRDAIAQLIAESARRLSRNEYSDEQIESAVASIFGVDTDLIDDGGLTRREDKKGTAKTHDIARIFK